jgi:hypothetical protein
VGPTDFSCRPLRQGCDGIASAVFRGCARAPWYHRERDQHLQVIYADGGASLLNPEVPGELQLTWFFLSVFIRGQNVFMFWPQMNTDEHG